MAAGPGARNADGAHVPMGVEVGDKVLLPGTYTTHGFQRIFIIYFYCGIVLWSEGQVTRVVKYHLEFGHLHTDSRLKHFKLKPLKTKDSEIVLQNLKSGKGLRFSFTFTHYGS